jgi:hypothetical protein
MHKFVKTLALTVCAAAILGAGALQAAARRSAPLEIPFAFKVHNKVLPAGTYRIQRGATDGFVTLLNIKTGQQVQILRTLGGETSKTRLVFEHDTDGYVLKKMS